MEGKIRVIIKRPDEEVGHVTNIRPSLKNLQNTVDGHIEYVQLAEDMILIVNEEGRINGSEFNCNIAGMPIYGTIIFSGYDPENEEHGMKDLPISFKDYKKLFGFGGAPK